MHLPASLHRNLKTAAMPAAMVFGALLCRPITALEQATQQMITPALIFLMLFITFCRVKPNQMKLSMLHFWLLLFQIIVSIGVYLLLLPFDPIIAQGGMICILAPIAMAAVVIGGMLGANVATMATYSLLCNMVIALLAPRRTDIYGQWGLYVRTDSEQGGPLLIMPFIVAQACRFSAELVSMDWGPQPDLFLPLVDIVIRHHRTNYGIHHRPA